MKKWSIKKKIITAYVFIVVVIIMIFGVFTSIISDHAYRKNAIRTYQNSANQIAINIQNGISNYSNYSFLIAQNALIVNLLSTPMDIYDSVYLLNTSIEPNIVFFINNYELVKSIKIYKEPKKSIPSRFFINNDLVSNEEWYINAINQYGAYCYFQDNHLFITKRILSFYDTVILGVVEFNIDFNLLVHTSMNDEHLQISAWNKEKLVYTDTKGTDLFELLKYDITGTDLTLCFYTNNSNIRPAFMQTYAIPFIIVLGCILLSGLLMILFFRYISHRIDTIITAVTSIEKREFIISLPPGEPDELGTLSECLNIMSDKIQNLIKEIRIVKDQERQAEIDALQAKITPHFLYNIMDTINWYAIDGDSDVICDITKNLAIYYRTNLNGGRTMTTVRKEIQNIQAYFRLQLRLTDNSFDVSFDMEDKLMDYSVCNFILQPIIENAIKHGINQLDERRGCITVRLYQNADFLCFDVEDNGVGIQEERIQYLLSEKGNSYGLNNIQERIQLMFGSEYGISIHSIYGLGTKVTINLPLAKKQTSGTE